MNEAEKNLLLTVARLLRAHLHDTIPTIPNRRDHSHMIDDIADLNEALAPFDAKLAVEINEAAEGGALTS